MTRRDIYGNSHKHVFLAVVPGGDDPFYGVKSVLFEMGITDIIDEVFSPSVNEIVRQVEYSYKLYFRAFFYRKVFVELRAILNQHLSDAEDHRLTIYVADEGFWTGFIWDAILSAIFDGSFNCLIVFIVSFETFLFIEVNFSNLLIAVAANGYKSSSLEITSLYEV